MVANNICYLVILIVTGKNVIVREVNDSNIVRSVLLLPASRTIGDIGNILCRLKTGFLKMLSCDDFSLECDISHT